MSRCLARILLVEDDVMVSEMLQEHLELGGYQVVTAADGIEGLEVFRVFEPDLVVTDYAMPRMNGVTMILRLHEMAPNLPVIMVTGYAYADPVIAMGVAAGVFVLLQKPLSALTLLSKIAAMLRPVAEADTTL